MVQREWRQRVNWDKTTLIILASFGCVTLLLTQISDVLSRLPPIIRAWRRVRQELRGGAERNARDQAGIVESTPSTLEADGSLGRPGTGAALGTSEE